RVRAAAALRYRVASTFLLFLLMLPGARASDPGHAPVSAALTAAVSDTPDGVRLRIQASGDVEPGSVEVRFAGRKAVVLARDAEGRAIRAQPLRLPARVVEEGVERRLRRRRRARDNAPQAGHLPGR